MIADTKYTEDELVLRLQQKNEQAFSYLYDNYAGAINGIIFRMVENVAVREDILQEVFVKIWNNIGQYNPTKGRLFTWMVNVAKNLTIDTIRSKDYRKQQKVTTDENTVAMVKDEQFKTERFDGIGLRKQLSNLKPEQRTIIDMAYFSGFTQDEISKQLNLPLGTVKTRMRSAILELRKILQ